MLKGCDMESPHSVNSPRRTLSLSRQRRATVSFPDPNDRNSGFGLSGDHDHGPKPSEVYGFVGSITTVVASGLVSYPPFYNFMIWENIYRYYSYKNITLILFNLLISNICNGENNKKKFSEFILSLGTYLLVHPSTLETESEHSYISLGFVWSNFKHILINPFRMCFTLPFYMADNYIMSLNEFKQNHVSHHFIIILET